MLYRCLGGEYKSLPSRGRRRGGWPLVYRGAEYNSGGRHRTSCGCFVCSLRRVHLPHIKYRRHGFRQFLRISRPKIAPLNIATRAVSRLPCCLPISVCLPLRLRSPARNQTYIKAKPGERRRCIKDIAIQFFSR